MTAPESDEKPPERYRRLMLELDVARATAGGTLSQAEEARRVDELDQTWWAMTDAEQDEYERAIGRAVAKWWRWGKVVKLGPRPSKGRGLRGVVVLPRWVLAVVGTLWLVQSVVTFWLGRLSR